MNIIYEFRFHISGAGALRSRDITAPGRTETEAVVAAVKHLQAEIGEFTLERVESRCLTPQRLPKRQQTSQRRRTRRSTEQVAA